MFSVCEPLDTCTTFAIGNCSLQVFVTIARENAWPGMPICTSYPVAGASSTMLPRHSPLRPSYHIGMAGFHSDWPAARYCTGQPAAPGFDAGFQYSPTAWNVGTALTPVEGSVGVCVGSGVGA